MAELTVENLSKSFAGQRVIEGISFTVPPGGFTIILGPSGCGKSTLLRLVAGLERPDAGRILVDGREVTGLPPKDRDMAMVFQSYALYPHLSVRENLAFPLRMAKLAGPEITRRVNEAAGLLGLAELLDRKPRQLSGGQRQRVAIGRAIVRNPKLFLFDEPLSNLDAKLRAGTRVELAQLHRKLEATVLYVTHDQVEAMTLGQEIVVLAEGAIQQIGAPREIYQRPRNLFVAGFIGTPAMNLFAGQVAAPKDEVVFTCPEGRIDIALPPGLAPYAGREITLGLRPEDLTPGSGQFEARLELVEQIGAESILYLKKGSLLLRARAEADFAGRSGQTISLYADPAKFHYFYQGVRIEP